MRSDNPPSRICPGIATMATAPSAQAATTGEKPTSTEILGLVHLDSVPGDQRQKIAECYPPEPGGAPPHGRASTRSRPRPKSTIADALRAFSDNPVKSLPPSGPLANIGRAFPDKHGQRARSPARRQAPSPTHEARQPSVRMIRCSHGSSTMAPTPAPANAMLMARPRRPHKPVRQELRMHRIRHHVGAAADGQPRAWRKDARATPPRARAAGRRPSA